MNLRQTKARLDKKIKEMCRTLNNHPIEAFVEAFDRMNIFKEYELAYGSWNIFITQHILQKLKEDHLPTRKKGMKSGKRRALRFIIAVKGLWQGKRKHIWVITSSAQLNDIRRFQDQKIRLIEQNMSLFDDWQDEVERRTGESQERFGSEFQQMFMRFRESMGINPHETAPSLPPSPEEDDLVDL